MRWIRAGDPLPTWRRWWEKPPPASGDVDFEDVRWRRVGDAELAISSRTGGWALLDADEAAALQRITRVEDAGRWRPIIDTAWQRGLIRVGGAGVFDSTASSAAIQQTRDYYTLVLL